MRDTGDVDLDETVKRLSAFRDPEQARAWVEGMLQTQGWRISDQHGSASYILSLEGLPPVPLPGRPPDVAVLNISRLLAHAREVATLSALAMPPAKQSYSVLLGGLIVSTGSKIVNLWEVTEDGRFLTLAEHAGTTTSPSLDVSLGRGIAGGCAQTGNEVDIPNFEKIPSALPKPQHPGFLKLHRLASGHYFPLKEDGYPLGVLAIYSDRKGAYSSATLTRARAIALRIERILASNRLIAQIQALEEGLEDSEISRKALAGNLQLVHEIGKWLAPVASSLLEPHPDYPALANRVTRYSTILTEILRTSGDYARLVQKAQHKTDLAAEVRRIFHDYRATLQRASITPHLSLPPDPMIVRLGPRATETLLTNLIENSVYFLRLDTKSERHSIRCTLEVEDDQALLTYHDNGPGFTEDTQTRIFDPFYTTKGDEGVGLGLFNVKQMVEAAGGSVTAHSKWGYYAEFFVRLPIVKPTKRKK